MSKKSIEKELIVLSPMLSFPMDNLDLFGRSTLKLLIVWD